ncbi:MAG: GGDEF and EAL domain-containing protein [Lachnospiraceae bacterium]|nr:GGDEF and EAL domain-containing protein [Lachnospiraceae bacterium]
MAKDILKNELFESFANASDNIYIYVCDMQSDLSRWSKNSVDYFDLEGEYIENAGGKWMEHVHPDDRDLYLKDIEAVFSGASSRHSCQYRAKNKYNDYVWLECKGSVISDEDGRPLFFAGIMTRLDNQNKYDPLTHLLTSFEMQKYDFSTGSGAILLFGINGFRKINNTNGFMYGNKVLVALAERLEQLAGKNNRVYRLQGDEFIVLAPNASKAELCKIFEGINDYCANIRGLKSFSVSAGIVSYPEDGTDFNTLMSNLEHSLEYAKDQKQGWVAEFSEKISQRHYRTSKLHEALTKSIHNNFEGFELYFQPILDAKTKKIVKCESLLRWKTPEIQDATPYEFIKLLENSGEIREVGFWVMEEALRHAAVWQKKYKDISVSFNVSYIQLLDGEFIDKMIEKANELQVDPQLVVVELTESCNAEDTEMLSRQFEKLQKLGFKIAMDDFGTEYASFGLLHDVNMDILKIDQKFVRGLIREGNMADMAIIESVVDMCRKLSIQTVAEGVETEEIQDIIRSIGVSFLQGYLYSKPVPADDFERMIMNEQC